MKPGQTCDAAKKLITGSRHDEHGDYRTTFRTMADLWSVHLGTDVEPWDVAVCMAQLKMVRFRENPSNEDNLTDACGYLDLAQSLFSHRS